ncbi:MAG TPA: GrpB family protein [Sphingomonadaceae bacterium]|nr:GrpB family protein [Sphingomonadaceae bacterium]
MSESSSDELGLSQGEVRLSEPTPRWTSLFEEERRRLDAALRLFGAAVEHCGSTSIPGISAKPILDILVGIPEPLEIMPVRGALAPLGYEHATWAGVPGHEVFGKGAPRTHLLHVVPFGGFAWNRMVHFRDALRGDASLASEYDQLKKQLAARFPNNRSAYTDAKAAFVERVLARY